MVFAFSGPRAGSFFVDYDNGSDFHKGTSIASAWRHCPGDGAAAPPVLLHPLHAGDTVFLKGGIVYNGSIAIFQSGTPGRSIVYDGNSAGTWGAGRAIIDGGNELLLGFQASGTGVRWITIRGFEIRNLKYVGVAPWESGKGILFENAQSVVVADCFIHDIGYWNNDGVVVPSGYGIVFKTSRECTVTLCEVARTGGTGIRFDGSRDCTISRNEIHQDITWGIDLNGDGGECTGNSITGNTIHDLYQYDRGFWKGGGDPPHTDFIFIRKGSGYHPCRNIVEGNLCYNDIAFTDFGGTAMTFLSFADSTVIRHNVFINAHSYWTVFFGWTSRGTCFCRNTVYCPRTGALRLSTGGDTRITGNLFISAPTAVSLDSARDEQGLIMGCNVYCMPGGDRAFVRNAPWTGWSFETWRSRGFDGNSRRVASIAEVQFTTTLPYPTHCRNMDLSLRPGSPADDSNCSTCPIPGNEPYRGAAGALP